MIVIVSSAVGRIPRSIESALKSIASAVDSNKGRYWRINRFSRTRSIMSQMLQIFERNDFPEPVFSDPYLSTSGGEKLCVVSKSFVNVFRLYVKVTRQVSYCRCSRGTSSREHWAST